MWQDHGGCKEDWSQHPQPRLEALQWPEVSLPPDLQVPLQPRIIVALNEEPFLLASPSEPVTRSSTKSSTTRALGGASYGRRCLLLALGLHGDTLVRNF